MLSTIVALVSSLGWGSSDLFGGIAARSLGTVRSVFWTYLGATVCVVAVAALTPGAWSAGAFLSGVVAGVCMVAGFLAFYASLRGAPIGIASALVAATETIVPVLVAVLALGERLSALAWIGVLAVVVGGVVIGYTPGERVRRSALVPLLLPAASGLGFGLGIVAFDLAPADAGFLPPAIELAVGLLVMGPIAWVASARAPREAAESGMAGSTSVRRGIAASLVGGVLLAFANVTLMFALDRGSMAVVGY